MATRKQTIVSRITELERANEANNAELEALRKELTETPEALLDRDPEADRKAEVEKMNAFLKQEGLLP